MFFNTGYYFEPDLNDLIFKVNPISHFNTKGQYESRNPSPFFDLKFYQDQGCLRDENPPKDPLSHFIVKGEFEGANPHPLIDTLFYKEQLKKMGVEPVGLLRHFIKNGLNNGCMPHPLIDPGYCLAQLPPDEHQSKTRLLKFFYEGFHYNIKNPHPLFDTEYYRTQLAPDDPEFENPLMHYAKIGLKQGWSTHSLFDVGYYLSNRNGSCSNMDDNPIVHYIYQGGQENRWPSLSIEKLPVKPQIGLFLLVNGPGFDYLSGRVLAIMSQLYPCWELTVIVRNPDDSDEYRYAKVLADGDRRVHWIETDDVDSPGHLLNRALKKHPNDFVIFLGEQMFLHAHALLTFVRQLNINPDLSFIHSERNGNDIDGVPIEHPDENHNVLTTRFFIGPLACFKHSVIDQMGGFDSWHKSAYDERFLTHYLHQMPQNSIAYISETLHYTLFIDPSHIVVRNH